MAIWIEDTHAVYEAVKEIQRLKEKARHAKYYKKNKRKIDAKQRKEDKIRDRVTYSREYYQKNKERINKASHERYVKNAEERKAYAREYYQKHKEEISKRRKELRARND